MASCYHSPQHSFTPAIFTLFFCAKCIPSIFPTGHLACLHYASRPHGFLSSSKFCSSVTFSVKLSMASPPIKDINLTHFPAQATTLSLRGYLFYVYLRTVCLSLLEVKFKQGHGLLSVWFTDIFT